MKETLSEFLKLQNDRMKSPFFSAIVFSLLFYNWDLFYYLFSYDADILAKIAYVKSELPKRSLLEPFSLTVILLIVPLIVNNIIQLISDYIYSFRSEKLNRYRISRGRGELEIATLEARKNFEPQRIEAETLNNIEGLRNENNNLNDLLLSHKGHISELTAALDSERVTTTEIRTKNNAMSSDLNSLKEQNKLLTQKLNESIDKYDSLEKAILLIKAEKTGKDIVENNESQKITSQIDINNPADIDKIVMNIMPNKETMDMVNALRENLPNKETMDMVNALRENLPNKETMIMVNALREKKPNKEFMNMVDTIRENMPNKEFMNMADTIRENMPNKEFMNMADTIRENMPNKELIDSHKLISEENQAKNKSLGFHKK
ncbi:hypothetical protein [Shewanella baltica]|uniref:hypothetical protein n=1 Tax=Shewanella baltica TaxID=62322 RepID=UPI003D7BF8B8